MRMESSGFASSCDLSMSDRKRILSSASDAFEMSSRTKICSAHHI